MGRQEDSDLARFLQAENSKMLHQASMKLFDSVPVCLNCMRVYNFLNELYTRLEENIERKEEDSRKARNTIFVGLDPKLNDKVIGTIRRQLERREHRSRLGKALTPLQGRSSVDLGGTSNSSLGRGSDRGSIVGPDDPVILMAKRFLGDLT